MSVHPEWWPLLVESVKAHEGTGPRKGDRFLPYHDSVGKLTIGYGRNLADNGITQAEAEAMLAHDLDVAYRECLTRWPWLRTQTANRTAVIVEMAYNLGVPKLARFGRMWEALQKGRYGEAAQEMRDSLWATQVKGRAMRLAERMQRG